MKDILITIIKGNIVVLLIAVSIYVIEINTNLKLLVKMFRIPKNIKMARGAASFHALLYFLICLVTLIYDRLRMEEIPTGYAFWKWLMIMIPLTVAFRIIYYRLTPKDPGRDDFDFSE